MKKNKVERFISFTLAVVMMFGLFAGVPVSAKEQTNINKIYVPEIYNPVTSINNSAPTVSIDSYIYMTVCNRPIEVQYSFPNDPDFTSLTIVIVMPGLNRDENGNYMKSFSYLSRTENICVITPKFSEAYFPTSEYQRVNIGSTTPYEEWTFNNLDSLFEDFITRFSLKIDLSENLKRGEKSVIL